MEHNKESFSNRYSFGCAFSSGGDRSATSSGYNIRGVYDGGCDSFRIVFHGVLRFWNDCGRHSGKFNTIIGLSLNGALIISNSPLSLIK